LQKGTSSSVREIQPIVFSAYSAVPSLTDELPRADRAEQDGLAIEFAEYVCYAL
jgi:hypothetical protein